MRWTWTNSSQLRKPSPFKSNFRNAFSIFLILSYKESITIMIVSVIRVHTLLTLLAGAGASSVSPSPLPSWSG